MWRRATWAAALAILPISAISFGSAVYIIGELTDPCVVWGGGDTHSGAGAQTAANPCTQFRGVGETRTRAVLMLAGVQGLVLAAAALGIWGAVRSRRVALIAAGCVMLLEILPTTFSIWPLALFAGLGLLALAYRMPD
jgi:hypothetical protein